MSPQLLLFILRLASAVLLLVFMGLLFWYLYQDLMSTRTAAREQTSSLGILRVIASDAANPLVDTLFDLAPVTTIGRHSRNTIVLDDTYVSSEHTLLSWRDSQWWLEDLGSRNGTYLNGTILTDPVVISVGDVITIGGVRFKMDLLSRQGTDEKESGIRDSNP